MEQKNNQAERLRWRWREESNDDRSNADADTTPDIIDTDGDRRTVAGELIRYLDAHLLRDPLVLGQTYSVEMHHPALGKG